MAIDTSLEILIDSGESDDKKAELVSRILQAFEFRTRSVVYVTSYSAGSTSTSQATITVGGGTTDFGIRIIFDSAIITVGDVPSLLKTLLQVLESETLTLVHTASYTAGDRAYNLVLTLT